MNLIKFEFKKLWRSRLFIIFLLVSIGLVLGLFVRNAVYQDIIKAERRSEFLQYSFSTQRTVIVDESNLQEIGDEGDPVLEEEIRAGRVLVNKLRELATVMDEDQALEALVLENEVYELAIYYHELDKGFPLSIREMEEEMILNNELIRLGLPKEDLNVSIQPAVFSKQIVSLLFNSFGFFALIIIVGLPIVKEFDDQTIKLTYSLPVSHFRIVLAKWLSMVTSCVVWFICVIGTALLISKWFGKTVDGPFNYPFDTREAQFIYAGDYFQQAVGYGLLYLILLVSLFTFLTFWLKRTLLVQGALLSVFIIVEMMIRENFIYHWFPWNYQKLDTAVTQTVSGSGLAIGLIVALITILLLLTVGISKRRGRI